MNKYQKNQSAPLGQLLLQAFRWFDKSLLATLIARGGPEISQSQSMIFAYLELDKGTRASELARRIGVTRQAVHKTINELRALGLLELAPDPMNRSAKLVTLTPAGRENVFVALVAFVDIEAHLADRLGVETVTALRQALEKDWGKPIAARTQIKT